MVRGQCRRALGTLAPWLRNVHYRSHFDENVPAGTLIPESGSIIMPQPVEDRAFAFQNIDPIICTRA